MLWHKRGLGMPTPVCQLPSMKGVCYAARQYELTPMCMLADFDGENLSTRTSSG